MKQKHLLRRKSNLHKTFIPFSNFRSCLLETNRMDIIRRQKTSFMHGIGNTLTNLKPCMLTTFHEENCLRAWGQPISFFGYSGEKTKVEIREIIDMHMIPDLWM